MASDLRIAFCGASGTGKSALARGLVDRLHLLGNPVGSRSVARAFGLANPYDVDALGLRPAFQRELQRAKIEWEAEVPSFVTDRSTLDDLVYARIHCPEHVNGAFVQRAHRAARRYTHVFHTPLAAFQDVDDDPVRVADPAYHARFEALLVEELGVLAFTEPGLPIVVLHARTLSDRFRCIMDTIERTRR